MGVGRGMECGFSLFSDWYAASKLDNPPIHLTLPQRRPITLHGFGRLLQERLSDNTMVTTRLVFVSRWRTMRSLEAVYLWQAHSLSGMA